MDFSFNDEQRMIQETATKIGEQYGLDYWREHDKAKAFPREFWNEVCNAGIAGMTLPSEYGGSGLGTLEMCIAIEALSRGGGGATVGQFFMLNPIFGGVAIGKYGSDEMKKTLLPRLCEGTVNFCMALTEPDAGPTGAGRFEFGELPKIIAKAVSAAAVETGPKGGFAHSHAPHAGHPLIIIRHS